MGNAWAVSCGLEEALLFSSLENPTIVLHRGFHRQTGFWTRNRDAEYTEKADTPSKIKRVLFCFAQFYNSQCTNWGLLCDWWAARREGRTCALPNFMSLHEILFVIEKVWFKVYACICFLKTALRWRQDKPWRREWEKELRARDAELAKAWNFLCGITVGQEHAEKQ